MESTVSFAKCLPWLRPPAISPPRAQLCREDVRAARVLDVFDRVAECGYAAEAAHCVDVCHDARADATLWAAVVDVPVGGRGETRLQHWAAAGDAAHVAAVLDHGARVDRRNAYGETALMLAARGGHAAVVHVLLSRGADARRRTGAEADTPTALHVAAASRGPGAAAVVGELVRAGADVDARAGPLAVTPLMVACAHDRRAAARELLRLGADANARDGRDGGGRRGHTPLMAAACAGAVGCVSELAATASCDLHARDGGGRSAQVLAAAAGHSAVVTALAAAAAERLPPPPLRSRDGR